MGDFNVAPSNLDIHDPKKYEGGIMASEIERNALNNVLKERLIDSFRIFEKVQKGNLHPSLLFPANMEYLD